MSNDKVIEQCQSMAFSVVTDNLEQLKVAVEKCKNEAVSLALKRDSVVQVEKYADKTRVRVVVQKKLVNQVCEFVCKQEGIADQKIITLSHTNTEEYKSWVVVVWKILLIVFCGAVICAIQKFIQSTP